MVVHVYSKDGCGKCEAAKDKLNRMGLSYEEHDLAYHVSHHDGWRDDGSVDVLAAHAEMDTMPLLRVGESFLDYSGAMKVLKDMRKS
ncbi:MAG: glutaredoxin family protein [Planctomycetota bacterium]|jgi:glutaredoxin